MKKIPSQKTNPKGLHQRYNVYKANHSSVDEHAEYFVLRLDERGKDKIHVNACRTAMMTYANEIQDHLPELAKDLRERYGDQIDKPKAMIQRRRWEEFRDSKLLWWVNRTLHLLGWAICVDIDDDGKSVDAYPSRVKFRGFDHDTEEKNFIVLTEYLEKNVTEFAKEARDES